MYRIIVTKLDGYQIIRPVTALECMCWVCSLMDKGLQFNVEKDGKPAKMLDLLHRVL